ncbi:hypothetical protein SAMN05216383_1042 [Prevotella sp. KH2C16]|nr:hypothetical protein SAMN05216383_1042 [Prevotella sp. KH2C16]
MRNAMILLLILQYSICVHSQETCVPKTELNMQLKSLLEEDTLAYEHFLMIKRIICRDNYKDIDELRRGENKQFTTQNANSLCDKLREKGYLFFVVIDKNKLFDILGKNCYQEMISCRNNLSDDYLLLDDRNLISEAVSCPSSYNRQIYLDIISDYSNYYSCFDYWKTGNNNERIIEHVLKKYPYIKHMWYKQTPIEDVVLPGSN